MAKRPTPTPRTAPLQEIGVSGLRHASGYIFEEYLPQLSGEQGRRVFLEMSLNDATVGAVLGCLGLLMRATPWTAKPADESDEAKAEADFAESLIDDLSHSWEDFIGEAATMLTYGWAYHEVVYKRRIGPQEADPTKRSNYPDGRIGIRKLAPRAQDSLDRWELQDDGGIAGMWQRPPLGGPVRLIPIERAALFRTISRKNSPEGVSLLRTAYRSWYGKKSIEDFERIGIERELCGVPVVRAPADVINATEGPKAAQKNVLEKMARDLRFNEQAGVLLSSNTFIGPDGQISAVPLCDIELITSGGQRTINPDPTIRRLASDIARAMMSDFMLMGESGTSARGGYAMHEGKVDLFMQAVKTMLGQIAYPLNRFVLPRVWALNGLDYELMPTLTPGSPAPKDLAVIGKYLNDLAGAGDPIFPNDELHDFAMRAADMPASASEEL